MDEAVTTEETMTTTKKRKSILYLVVPLFVLYLLFYGYYHQTFQCIKADDACYSSMAGIKISKTFKLSDFKSITIEINEKILQGTKDGDNVNMTWYMPTYLAKDGSELPFYKSSTTNLTKAQKDTDAFVNFIKTDEKTLELQNRNTMFHVWVTITFALIIGYFFNKMIS